MTDIIIVAPSPRGYAEETQGHMPPLGLVYLHNELKKNGFSSKIFDFAISGNDYRKLKKLVVEEKPLVLGYSFGTDIRFEAFAVIEKIRKDFPGIINIAGGPHPTLADIDTLTHIRELDCIVRGEGEKVLVELMSRIKAGRPYADLKGITFRLNGAVTRNDPAPPIADLDILDSPYIALEIINDYPYQVLWEGKAYPMAIIFTGRGCPFQCTFCATAEFWGRRTRFRSNDNVIAELKYIIENYGITFFHFIDDTFNLNPRKLRELLQRILAELPPIHWLAGIRIDNIDRETLELMKRSGCFRVTYGIESADQRLVDEIICKQIDLNKVPQVEAWLKELAIERRSFFIISLPTETKEQAKKSIQMAQELGGDTTVNILRINPGTVVERIARERGVLRKDFTWSRVDLSQTYLRTIIGSSPIYIENLSWFYIGCALFEWASSGQSFFSPWRQIPEALRDIKSPGDIYKLSVLGLAFLWVQLKRIYRYILGLIPFLRKKGITAN